MWMQFHFEEPVTSGNLKKQYRIAETKKGFIYKDDIYLRVIPGKKLFNSTMVHEVVNRGDIFATRLKDQMLTIIPGSETPEIVEVHVFV
jgi:hypothetical protein